MFEQFQALVSVLLFICFLFFITFLPSYSCVVSLYVCILSLGLCKLNLVNYIEGFVSCLSFTTRFASSVVAQGVCVVLQVSLAISLPPCLSLSVFLPLLLFQLCCPSCPSCSCCLWSHQQLGLALLFMASSSSSSSQAQSEQLFS